MLSPAPHRRENARHAGITYGMGGVGRQEMNQYLLPPEVSMSTDGFVRMRRLQAQVSNQQRHISQLTARCNALGREVGVQARAQRANAAEITLLRSQLHQLQRWHVRQLEAASRGGTASSQDRHAGAAADEFQPTNILAASTSPLDGHLSRCEPPPGTAASRFYPREIPEEDREALRMRLMQDRGPARRHTPPEPQEAPCPRPAVSVVLQPSHPDCDTNPSMDTTSPSGAQDARQEASGLTQTTSPVRTQEPSELEHPLSPLGAQESNAVQRTMSPLDPREPSAAAGEDDEETEDECVDNHIGTDDEEDSEEDSDEDSTLSSHTVLDSKQEPRTLDERVEPRPVEVGLVKAEVRADRFSVTNPDLDITRDRVPPSSRDLTCPGNTQDQGRAADGSVSSSPSGGPVPAPSPAKEEPLSNNAEETAVVPAPPAARYTHRLFSSSSTGIDDDVRHGEPSMDSDDARDSTNKREAVTRENNDASSVDSEPLHRDDLSRGWDRYQHCTFCSLCQAFRTEPQAVAKCEACPRIVCRGCAKGKGEEVPRGRFADDVALPADKCLCQTEDRKFPKPREGKDPQAHLLKHLLRHDLSRMFREPVDVEDNPGYLGVVPREEMMDLRTVEIKLKKNKQYRSPRGQMLFRADLQKIWSNCWKYAAYRPDRGDTPAGIVRCTLILQSMVEKFYVDHMQRHELATNGMWQAGSVRRERERSARCTRPAPNPQLWPSGTFAGVLDPAEDSEEETDTDLDDENSRIAATVGHKRRLVIDDDDDGFDSESGIGTSPKSVVAPVSLADATAASRGESLDRNLCALATIGKTLGSSRGHV